MNCNAIFWAMGMLILASSWGQAQSMVGTTLSLAEATEQALENNFGIQVARLRAETAEVNDSWGGAGALPALGLRTAGSSTITDQSENPTSFIQEKLEAESFDVSGQLNWTLFDGMGMFANKRSLELLAEQSGGEVDLMVEQTAQAVISAYQAVVVQDSILSMLRETLNLSRDRLDWVRKREDLGSAGSFETMQFENALWSDSVAWVRQNSARRTAMRNFNRLLGADETSEWRLTTPLAPLQPFEERFPDREELVLRVSTDATRVRNARLAEALAQTGVDQAQARLYPVLGLNVNLGDLRSEFAAGEFSGAGRTRNQGASLVLNFNLFNGGTTKRAIEQARIQLEMAGVSRMDESAAAAQSIRNALDAYKTQEVIWELLREAASNADDLLDLAKTRFEFGSINSFDYREIQIAALQANLAQLQELQIWHQAHWEVERLTGKLSLQMKD